MQEGEKDLPGPGRGVVMSRAWTWGAVVSLCVQDAGGGSFIGSGGASVGLSGVDGVVVLTGGVQAVKWQWWTAGILAWRWGSLGPHQWAFRV